MNGHRTPRRHAVGHHLLSSTQRSRNLVSPPLVLALFVALLAVSVAVAGCGSESSGSTTTAAAQVPALSTTTTAEPVASVFPVNVRDDNGNVVTVAAEPMRIVSTAPANTETLFALGVGDRVVGVNEYDDYPPEVADIAKVGDYQANTEAITALSPDLVVGYSGNEEALAPLQTAGVPVLIMNPTTLDGIYTNIAVIGAATGVSDAAADLASSLKDRLAQISDAAKGTGESPKVFYALDNTLWTSGPGSFVDELLALAGATNVASADAGVTDAYLQFSPEQLVAADPDVILLPGSMYTSADEFTADPRFAGLTAVTEGRVVVIDDVIVTRPGPRIADGLQILVEAIHPGVIWPQA